MAQNRDGRFLKFNTREVEWFDLAPHSCYIAQHFGRLAQQHAHRHLDW